MSLTGAYQNSPAHSRWAAFGCGESEIPPAGGRRYLDALPGGALRSDVSQPSGLTALLSVSVSAVR